VHHEPFGDRTAMNGEAPDHLEEEKTLDPAAENVRRKMLRFMFINLGILFFALMAVMVALVYKSFGPSPSDTVTQAPPSSEMISGSILLPPSSQVVSQSLDGNRITLHIRRNGGGESILLYDLTERRVIGNFEIGWQGQ